MDERMENRKKKLGVFLLILLVAGLLFLCLKEEKEEPLEIGVSLYQEEDTFIEKILAGMEKGAKEYVENTGSF